MQESATERRLDRPLDPDDSNTGPSFCLGDTPQPKIEAAALFPECPTHPSECPLHGVSAFPALLALPSVKAAGIQDRLQSPS